jgi:hypothetical protein
MKMNGLKPQNYYLAHSLTFFFLHAVTSFLFIIAGIIGRLSLFTKSNALVLIILFVVWGIAQTSLAFLISTFFSRARTAYNSTMILVIVSVISFIAIRLSSPEDSFKSPEQLLWAPFAFYKALSVANLSSFVPYMEVIKFSLISCCKCLIIAHKPLTVNALAPGNEFSFALGMMLADSLIYAVLSFYLSQVLPQEFGLRKPWYFPLRSIVKFFMSIGKSQESDTVEAFNDSPVVVEIDQANLEDEDVKFEKERVIGNKFDAQSPLVLKRIHKRFKRLGLPDKVAVGDVSLAISKGTVFGL